MGCPCNWNSSNLVAVHYLFQLLHGLHLHVGKLSDIPDDILPDGWTRVQSPNCSLLHIKLTTKWTVVACLGFLSRAVAIESKPEVILPRFTQFVGHGWAAESLSGNQVDSFSLPQIDRLYRQVTFGLLFELTEVSERRMKMFETSSNSRSFALTSNYSAFSCSCLKVINPDDLWPLSFLD